MRMLLTNDDGVGAPGLRTLAKCLASAGHEVIVIAPDRERSGVSRCHAVRQELDLVRIEKENPYETWTLEGGTPVDCVMAAVAAFDGLELVIAGINRGPNLGRNIFYSGTVAAAAESVWRGLPAIAVSCAAISADRWWFETAAEVVKRLVAEGLPGRLNQELLLNVNVPNVPVAEIQGWVVSPPDRALHNWEKYRLEGDGLARYHLRPDGVVVNSRAAAGTDADAVQRRLVAVTPLGASLPWVPTCEPGKSAGWSCRNGERAGHRRSGPPSPGKGARRHHEAMACRPSRRQRAGAGKHPGSHRESRGLRGRCC